MLEFCKKCKNLLYISANFDEETSKSILFKECKYCNTKDNYTGSAMKIIETNYNKNNILHQKYYADISENGIPINKLLANDPTLPRIIDKNIKAPTNYKHSSDDPVSYIKNIDGTYLWISTKTGEIWH